MTLISADQALNDAATAEGLTQRKIATVTISMEYTVRFIEEDDTR